MQIGLHRKSFLPLLIPRESVGPSLVGKRILTGMLRFYQLFLSPLLGPSCRFYPSCSSYAIEAVEKYGMLRGSKLSLIRLAKCHPWHPGGYDPLP